jgi:phosphatidylglycerol:prolipoprotein diacylglycerol transferase
MHPVFFEINIPEFLPATITIYSYGFFIACGAIAGFAYTAYQAKKQLGVKVETIQMFVVLIIIASVIGGKFFIIFENPKLYLSEPSRLMDGFNTGFEEG